MVLGLSDEVISLIIVLLLSAVALGVLFFGIGNVNEAINYSERLNFSTKLLLITVLSFIVGLMKTVWKLPFDLFPIVNGLLVGKFFYSFFYQRYSEDKLMLGIYMLSIFLFSTVISDMAVALFNDIGISLYAKSFFGGFASFMSATKIDTNVALSLFFWLWGASLSVKG